MIIRKVWHNLFFLLPLLGTMANAQNISWDSAIESVSKSADAYRNYAIKEGTSWAGTMYNGYKSEEHTCAILGRMLGFEGYITHLEEFDYPPMTKRSDPHDLLVFSISLENWAGAARWAVDAKPHTRANTWNLDCVGHFDIPTNLRMKSESEKAEFEVAEYGQLLVYGDIDVGFYDRLTAVLNANPNIEEVVLGSGGGSVRDAILSGLEIRNRGLNTTIYGNCYSACPLVFMGGIQRVIWAAPHRLGFHQVYTGNGVALPASNPVYMGIGSYLEAMGVDARAVIMWMLSATPSDMFVPDVKLLCAPNVATFVQRVCSSDGQLR